MYPSPPATSFHFSSGLGKTLQAITTIYTLLRHGYRGPETPIVRRCIVVCPCSLVNNWAQEFDKWVNSKVKTEEEKILPMVMSSTDKKSVLFSITGFLHHSCKQHVLIISYETFRTVTIPLLHQICLHRFNS